MWPEITRPKYEPDQRRYASDLTDAEWELVEPHMPPARPLGRPRWMDPHEVVSGVLQGRSKLPVASMTRRASSQAERRLTRSQRPRLVLASGCAG